ncbi:LacI family DNA-binding transcriptional regulator [Paenibacillus kribbensis]|uniref:LacI family DNA-binding transcriptional regulator n=1 Tax=Paenibacillus kribbensis TaxID=172713 RepID=UPI000839695C|nr:LacI family DNA-binding transcriptional regulator [Paenibacillus kribbensis]
MATIKDIARLAEVSATTVSRILNQDPTFSVSGKTRDKVLEAAKQLEYKTIVERYNQKYYRLALMYKPIIFHNHIENDFHFSIRSGIDKYCSQHGIDMVNLFNNSNVKFENLQGAIIQGNYSNEEIKEMTSMLDTEHLLIIGRCPDDNKYDSVWFDARRAIHSALDYLVSLGHTEIGYIGGDENEDVDLDEQREQIFLRYMQKHFQKTPRTFVGENSLKNGYALMKKAFETEPLPSAFFIANDPLALGALEYLKEHNITIPDAFSIVSFDGHQMTQYTTPALTTVQIRTEFMGITAVQTLIEKIDGVRSISKKVLLPTQLRIGESCTPRS